MRTVSAVPSRGSGRSASSGADVPEIVSIAVLHGDPPDVFVAEDLETLHRLLALRVVAQVPSTSLPKRVVDEIRAALLDERWGAAVEAWMRTNDEVLDVYESWDLVLATDVELVDAELQFTPLFQDQAP